VAQGEDGMSNFIDNKTSLKYQSGGIDDGELIQYMYKKGNGIMQENERLKKELEEMKAKYKGCCGTTI